MKKTKLNKKLLPKLLVVFILTLMFLKPSEIKASSFSENSVDSTWTLDTSVNNVDCYYKISNCNGISVIYLIFNNKNSSDVKISWDDVVFTQFENSEEFANKKELVLQSGESSSNDCNSSSGKCVVRGDQLTFPYIPVFKKYKFSKVTVK